MCVCWDPSASNTADSKYNEISLAIEIKKKLKHTEVFEAFQVFAKIFIYFFLLLNKWELCIYDTERNHKVSSQVYMVHMKIIGWKNNTQIQDNKCYCLNCVIFFFFSGFEHYIKYYKICILQLSKWIWIKQQQQQ